MRDHDTDDAARAAQVAVWRRMTGDQRVRLAIAMSEDARAISLAGIRSRHPEYSEAQARLALYRLCLGDELFRAAWPKEPMLAP